MDFQNSVRLKHQGDIAYLEFDLQGEKINKLSSPVMRRLEELVTEVKASSAKVLVLISRKERIFIAGADIEEIRSLKKREDVAVIAVGHRIFNAVEDLPIPVVAAIHGACLGGGCELSLACDYRICTDDKNTRIGLPETRLGIIPGLGGCVRLPRVVGLQAALDIILAGKSVDGLKALKIGLVDKCVPAPIFEQEVADFAKEIIAGGGKKRRKTYSPKGLLNTFLESPLGRPIVFSQARKTVLKETQGNYPAPLKAIDVISRTYGVSDRGKALAIETAGFADVVITDVSKNLISLFYLTEGIKKKNGLPPGSDAQPRPVRSMAVLGAGTMGGGIAQLFADQFIRVRLKDLNFDAIGKGLAAAREVWDKQVARRRLSPFERDEKLSYISGGTDYAGFKKLDLVIEAIVEDLEIKKRVIAETAAHCGEQTIFATNTSSLSVTEMANAHPNPALFAGLHFFNPVHKMPLVEVIRGPRTSDETTTTIFELAKQTGKFPVVVKDGPGFLVNRLLLPYMNEAVYLFEQGLSIEAIDKAYVQFGMPMGPLRLLDEVGIDVAVKVAKIFGVAFGERAKPSELMSRLAGSGRAGKKNAKGFYIYENGRQKGVDETIYSELGLGRPSTKLDSDEIVQRGIFMMINEATRALVDDRIVESAEEVDLGMIMGTGFPPFRGGLLKYADSVGAETIVSNLEKFMAKYGPRFLPAPSLKEMAKGRKTFYG